jgi:hypothetical protein
MVGIGGLVRKNQEGSDRMDWDRADWAGLTVDQERTIELVESRLVDRNAQFAIARSKWTDRNRLIELD